MEESNNIVEFEEIDLREYFKILVQRKKLIIGFVLAGLLIGIGINFFLEPFYKSNAIIKLSNSSGEYSNIDYVKQKLKSLGYFEVINESLELGYNVDYLNKLKEDNLEINSIENNILDISFTSNYPQQTQLILNELIKLFEIDSYKKFEVAKQEKLEYLSIINNEIKILKNNLEILEQNKVKSANLDLSIVEGLIINNNTNVRLKSIREINLELIKQRQKILNELNNMDDMEIIDNPIFPSYPIKPNKKLNLAISGILALMLGIFSAFFLEFLTE